MTKQQKEKVIEFITERDVIAEETGNRPADIAYLMTREKVENMENFTIEEAWDLLIDMGVSEETLQTVTDINGYNMESMNDILYSRFGENDFDEMEV